MLTEQTFEDYVAAGFNMIFLGGENGWSGSTAWKESQTKKAWDLALGAGVDKILLHDSRLSNLVYHKDTLIGEEFANYYELVDYVKSCLSDYYRYPGFYGVRIHDEPDLSFVGSYGYVYRAIKDAAKQLGMDYIYVHINLLPTEPGAFSRYILDGSYNNKTVSDAYRDYLIAFIESTGADTICVDSYPFKPSKTNPGERFLEGYYVNLQILAEVCAEYDVRVAFVLQSFEMYYKEGASNNGFRRIDNIQEMYLQVASVLGYGVKEISFYTYMTMQTSEDSSYSSEDGSSFIDKNGNLTEIYEYAQSAIADARTIANTLLDYKYKGSQLLIAENAKDYTYIYNQTSAYNTVYTGDSLVWISVSSGKFDNSHTFSQLTSVTNSKDVMLVTELGNDEGQSCIMVQNVLDPLYWDGTDMEISLQFSSEYTKVAVYCYGEIGGNADFESGHTTFVQLVDGTFTATVPAGYAVYLFPIK